MAGAAKEPEQQDQRPGRRHAEEGDSEGGRAGERAGRGDGDEPRRQQGREPPMTFDDEAEIGRPAILVTTQREDLHRLGEHGVVNRGEKQEQLIGDRECAEVRRRQPARQRQVEGEVGEREQDQIDEGPAGSADPAAQDLSRPGIGHSKATIYWSIRAMMGRRRPAVMRLSRGGAASRPRLVPPAPRCPTSCP